ncbi:MAG: tetrathionate reductase family octaheme c-type cytochrome [Desulfuromonadaceae bacterium]|nr:tetrathionate reductase family octaheme c-type cytochrome [Desulfuromonadaceae bacterium]
MKKSVMILFMVSVLVLVALQAFAGQDHSEFVKGPFKSGQEVTKVCLECHEKQAGDFMKTSHWKWKGTPNHVKGMENSKKEFGKANMINAFCTSIQGGKDGLVHEACGKCHAGYGWTRTNYDFSKKENVDCLVCHSTKGNYQRAAKGCVVDTKSMDRGSMDLNLAAKSVGLPTRRNCGYCHFFGGGADAVKHAGLDSTMEKPAKKQDVHMGSTATGGQDMTCQACHVTKDHKIGGASSTMAHFDSRVNCEQCHTGTKAPHQKSKNGKILSRHLAAVACQTCHIPVFSKEQATKMSWKWSDMGKDLKAEEQFDKETFAKKKGTFTWGMNVKPVYAWNNGMIERYMVGDKIKDPSKTVYMARPVGSINDRTAKIYPYKLFTGDQPMDSKYKYLSIFQQYESLWVDFNWDNAIKNGAEGSGLLYSGKFQFVNTATYIAAEHEVSPKEDALQCGECHMGGDRMDWKNLGYKGDPMKFGGRKMAGNQ